VEITPTCSRCTPGAVDAVWAAVEPLIPIHVPNPHPLGCHRPRIADRVCFEAVLRRLVTGCSWDVAGRINGAGETTAPFGGEGTGPNPTDRGKSGWKWSVATDRSGIPLGWVINGANRNDCIMFDPMVTALADRELLADIETLHLDKGYDNNIVRNRCAKLGIDDLVCAKRRKPGEPKPTEVKNGPHTLGLRWPVERTNSWFSNFGQLRRNTDRFNDQRLAQIDLAVSCILVVKLIKWVDRWSPHPCPIGARSQR